MFSMTFEILGNLFLVKFFAKSRKKVRILIFDVRFCLSTSLLNGSRHLLFLKKRQVLFASDLYLKSKKMQKVPLIVGKPVVGCAVVGKYVASGINLPKNIHNLWFHQKIKV